MKIFERLWNPVSILLLIIGCGIYAIPGEELDLLGIVIAGTGGFGLATGTKPKTKVS